MAFAQLRTALYFPTCPGWARRALMAMPREMACHIYHGAFEWSESQQGNLLHSVGSGAVVANVARAKSCPGLPERCAGHYNALLGFQSRRDSELPRYFSLRKSVGRIGFLPV
eukprot:9476511-Pyramimonas_sp.AAC.1